jgi:hypothetical protein
MWYRGQADTFKHAPMCTLTSTKGTFEICLPGQKQWCTRDRGTEGLRSEAPVCQRGPSAAYRGSTLLWQRKEPRASRIVTTYVIK